MALFSWRIMRIVYRNKIKKRSEKYKESK